MNKMTAFYQNLIGLTEKIERRWLQENYNSDVFSDVVWELTNDTDLALLGDLRNQLELLEYGPVRAVQALNTFSDFYFQIYNNGRFYIEVLNWWGGQVNAHDHDFSGVQFQLKGDALNVIHDFNCRQQIGAVRFGKLSARRAEYWKEGGRTKVFHGDIELHSVFHLGRPTTSLLIRTVPTNRYGAQSNYFKNLAAHYYVNTLQQRKKLTALRLLSKGDESGFRERIRHCFSEQSLSENLFMLVKLGTAFFDPRYAPLMTEYARTCPEAEQVVLAALVNTAEDHLRDIAHDCLAATLQERMAIHALIASADSTDLRRVVTDVPIGAPLPLIDTFRSKLDEVRKRRFDIALKVLGGRLQGLTASAADTPRAPLPSDLVRIVAPVS